MVGGVRTATVTAVTDTTCLMTNAGFMDRLSKEGKLLFAYALQQALAEILENRLRDMNDELVKHQEALEASQKEVQLLKRRNESLERDYAQALARGGVRFHGPRQRDDG